MKKLPRLALPVTVLCLLCAGQLPALAQKEGSSDEGSSTTRARRHFQNGVEYYRDGDLEGALVEFKRAMDAQPNYKLLFNLGQVSQELRDYPGAQDYFERYLAEGGDEVSDERRRLVESELEKLAGRIATLTLTCNLADTEFFVDDVSVGSAPLPGPVKVSAGQRRIVATHAGRTSLSRVIDVAGREALMVHLEFPVADTVAERPTGDLRSTATATLPRDTGGVHPALIVGIASGALLAGAGVAAYLTLNDEDAYNNELQERTTRETLNDIKDRAQTKALITDVLLGLGVVGAVTTVVLALTHDSEVEAATGRSQAPVVVKIGAGSIHVQGQL